MSNVVFDVYHKQLVDLYWPTAPVMCAMFDSDTWTPGKSDVYVADALAAGAIECAAASYVRVALTSPVTALDGSGHRSLLQSAVADFGTLEAGFDFDTFLLYNFVTDDSDSWLLAAYDVGAQTTDVTGTRFVPDTAGLFRVLQP